MDKGETHPQADCFRRDGDKGSTGLFYGDVAVASKT